MKVVKALTICAGLLLAVTANTAAARPGGGFGGHGGAHYAGHGAYHGGGWGGGRWVGGGWIGGLYINPWWYADAYPYYAVPGVYGYDAYEGAVAAPASPPVYVEHNGIANSSPGNQQGDWYYCQNPTGYYPYVRSCSQAWQRVPARPPGAQ